MSSPFSRALLGDAGGLGDQTRNATAPRLRPLRVRRPLGVMLEQFPKPLAAALGHDAPVPPPAWGARGGRDEGDGLRVLGEGLGTRTDLCTAVTDGLLALHRFALPSIRALVTS